MNLVFHTVFWNLRHFNKPSLDKVYGYHVSSEVIYDDFWPCFFLHTEHVMLSIFRLVIVWQRKDVFNPMFTIRMYRTATCLLPCIKSHGSWLKGTVSMFGMWEEGNWSQASWCSGEKLNVNESIHPSLNGELLNADWPSSCWLMHGPVDAWGGGDKSWFIAYMWLVKVGRFLGQPYNPVLLNSLAYWAS